MTHRKKAALVLVVSPIPLDEVNDENALGLAYKHSLEASAEQPWECQSCSLENEGWREVCSVCFTERGRFFWLSPSSVLQCCLCRASDTEFGHVNFHALAVRFLHL